MEICRECQAHVPEYLQTRRNFDSGRTVVNANGVHIILQHCSFCGKLMIITQDVQELAHELQ